MVEKKVRIFLSGTEDVEDITEKLYYILENMGYEPYWYKKKFPILTADAIQECFNNIKDVHRFILIISEEYGTIYEKSGLSIIEEEFNAAYKLNIPILVFIKTNVYNEIKKYCALKETQESLVEESFEKLSFDADKDVYEFICRIQNLKEKDKSKVPWIFPYVSLGDFIEQVEYKWVPSKGKIAFIGLDNAGKSSIVLTIKREFGYEEFIRDLIPTRGLNRSRKAIRFLKQNLRCWDFGGQNQYREDLYFTKPELFFSEITILIYVIDIQDSFRFEEATQYFDRILRVLNDLDEYPPIMVFFHKSDPSIVESPELNKKAIDLEKLLRNKCKGNFEINFMKTSIFDIQSILQGFSKGLAVIFNQLEYINKLFIELSRLYNAIMVSLFDSNGFTLGEYYRRKLTLKDKKTLYSLFVLTIDNHIFQFSGIFENGTKFHGLVKELKFGTMDCYFAIIVDEESATGIFDTIEDAKLKVEKLILGITPISD